jgi:hypothetical protein
MGHISMATRDELVVALAGRYASSSRKHRGCILDEFVAVSGFHRKHAMRLLRAGRSGPGAGPRPARRLYNEAVREALIVIWEAADRVCGKRLRPLVPILVEAMERHGHLQLAPEVRASLVLMSAATIDRALCKVKEQASGGPRRRSASSTGVRRSVPIRTFDGWNDPAPGFMEADLVAHSGPVAEGSFIQTLTMTDIATGWTECAPLLVREQTVLVAVLSEIRKRMPFPLLGFDTDNDSVFMNETVQSYCKEAEVEFTRCRPYRKNDQAWVEQKNGAVVRRIVGYRRFVGLEAAAALGRLYMSVRLYVNFFQPSFKLASKARDGARVTKRYHPPATPYQRLLADPRTSGTLRARLSAIQATLDPVRLLSKIRAAQKQLVEIADRPVTGDAAARVTEPTLAQFLEGLRTSWQEGEVRPTSKRKGKVSKNLRRCPDPFLTVTAQMREWFDVEPWRTSRELLVRLQVQQPDAYPIKLLRTLQRRVKVWRRENAHQLVFGGAPPGGELEQPPLQSVT